MGSPEREREREREFMINDVPYWGVWREFITTILHDETMTRP